ncbi:MAG: C4-type zinc ribbon domain-containing protein [Nitrospirota bacterium]
MNEQLKLLIDLQDVDSAVLLIAEQIESLPARLDQFKIPLKEAKEAFQKAQAKNESLIKKKKEKDLKLDEIQDTIDKMKSRSGEVKTNKEYDAHLKEIESFKKNIYKTEDEILALMEGIENFSSELKDEEIKIKKVEEEYKQQEKVIGEEQKKLHADMETQKARRNEFIDKLEKGNYRQYINLLERSGGKAVVETKNEVCYGCNTNIPPQLFNDIKKNEGIFTCFYCKRFLFFKEPVPEENEPQKAPPVS